MEKKGGKKKGVDKDDYDEILAEEEDGILVESDGGKHNKEGGDNSNNKDYICIQNKKTLVKHQVMITKNKE